jgi:hypothetical protein
MCVFPGPLLVLRIAEVNGRLAGFSHRGGKLVFRARIVIR